MSYPTENIDKNRSAVSHIPQFGDAASPTGDVDISAGEAHL